MMQTANISAMIGSGQTGGAESGAQAAAAKQRSVAEGLQCACERNMTLSITVTQRSSFFQRGVYEARALGGNCCAGRKRARELKESCLNGRENV